MFKVDAAGHETVLYSFCSLTNCIDGYNPKAGLILDAAGNLYGTTYDGGALASNGGSGAGTVFKVDVSGRETVLYSFCSAGLPNCTDGAFPLAGLAQDTFGNLYGTTNAGGAHNNGGVVFKVDSTGHESVLYSFCSASNCTDGRDPLAGLIVLATGDVYGTTSAGGAHGSGAVFKVDSAGNESVVYNFCSLSKCSDGSAPQASLIQDAAGTLYGTTSGGGANQAGAVFKIDSKGNETVLYNFCSKPVANSNGGTACADGNNPVAGLVQDSVGNLYGTTFSGGTFSAAFPYGVGTVFKVDIFGHETVLHSFGSFVGDGILPQAGLILDATGTLFGATTEGGAFNAVNGYSNDGMIFSLGGAAAPACADADGDSLCDLWENTGIDVDGDGVIDLDLRSLGADPNHKDIFVEVDYMDCNLGGCAPGDTHSHKPDPTTIAALQVAFAKSPVTNPDNVTGIHIHIILDEAIPHSNYQASGCPAGVATCSPILFGTRGPGANDDFLDYKLGSNDPAMLGNPCDIHSYDGHFGSLADRQSPNCQNILAAKRLVFHYVIFGHDYAETVGSTGIAKGAPGIPGNNVFITLGSGFNNWTPAQIAAVGQGAIEAGTLMHELGHNLGLGHGGDDSINCKPNYLSVMSYSLQIPSVDPTRPLDYSSLSLMPLDESNLDENAGLGTLATGLTRHTVYGVDSNGGLCSAASVNCIRRVVPAGGHIDWNNNGIWTDLNVAADIKRLDVFNTPTNIQCGGALNGGPPNVALNSFNDWINLIYDFRDSANFSDGVSPITPDSELTGDAALAAGQGVIRTLPVVSLLPPALNFPNEAVGTSSPAQTATLHNTGNYELTIHSVTVTGADAGDFTQTTDCPITPLPPYSQALPANATCSLRVTFTPTASGARVASLVIADTADGSPHVIPLAGQNLSCDVNGDGSANVADVQLVINEALGVTPPNNDLNQDGVVNVADVQIVINAALALGCSAK